MSKPIKTEPKNMARSAGVVSIAVMFSRILGLAREQIMAYFFGAGVAADAFYAAFRIPNLLRDLFGEGVLSKAFVTTFAATEIEDGEEAAWVLTNRVFNGISIILLVITSIGIITAPAIINFMYSGEGFDVKMNPEVHFEFTNKRDLTTHLTRIMFPYLPLVSIAAIAMGLLNSKKIFGIPAFASSAFNVFTVLIGVIGYHVAPKIGHHPVDGMALGVLMGGLAQILIQIPSMWKVGFRYRPLLSFSDRRVKQIMKMVGPAIIGVAALEVNVLVNSIFASKGEGWITWIGWAFRLMHLPIGLFGVAISTVALPNLAEHVVAKNITQFRNSYSLALRLVFFLTIPASIGLMVLAEPICRLIFEVGNSTPHDTHQTAGALFFYTFGLCGYSAVKIATDGFYAHSDTATPVKISITSVLLNILLNYVFIYKLGFGHRSLALSTAFTITFNFLTLQFLLSRKIGKLGLEGIWLMLGKLLSASLLMGIVSYLLNLQIESIVGIESLMGRLLGVLVPIGVGIVFFAGSCKLLRLREFDLLVASFFRRGRR